MKDKLELKSSHEVVDTVYVANIESIFHGKPTDPDILTVIMKDGKRLYCDEVCPMQEEPVSEGLEEAAYHNCIDRLSKESIEDFKACAKWQKSEDAKLIINAKDDGYRLGLATMKQQIMKDATEVTVHVDAGGYPYIPQMELYDYDNDVPLAKEGDKYKVVLIKEE